MSTSYSRQRVRGTDIDVERVVEEPFRAILLHSPGRKPWVIIVNTFIEPQRGGTPIDKVKCSRCSAAPTELLIFVSPVYPGFHFGLCPYSTLGFEECRPCRAHLRYPQQSITLNHCIIRHSLRYYRHSGLVIYISKLPAPSVSMPCDYRILKRSLLGYFDFDELALAEPLSQGQ